MEIKIVRNGQNSNSIAANKKAPRSTVTNMLIIASEAASTISSRSYIIAIHAFLREVSPATYFARSLITLQGIGEVRKATSGWGGKSSGPRVAPGGLSRSHRTGVFGPEWWCQMTGACKEFCVCQPYDEPLGGGTYGKLCEHIPTPDRTVKQASDETVVGVRGLVIANTSTA